MNIDEIQSILMGLGFRCRGLDLKSSPKRLWIAWNGHSFETFPQKLLFGNLVFINKGKFRDDIIYECVD